MSKEVHYYCNKCGKELNDWDLLAGFSISGKLGFGSKHDGDYLDLDLCCNCMDELLDQCKVSAITPTREHRIKAYMTDEIAQYLNSD